MELYGTKFSPFVRRIRVLLNSKELSFKELDFEKDYDELLDLSPIGKVPVLKDGDVKISDSFRIYNYLKEKKGWPSLSLEEETWLNWVNEVSDSLIIIIQLSRSGIEDDKNTYLQRQWSRVERIYNLINNDEKLLNTEWNFTTISLFCLLDWAEFRELADYNELDNLAKFMASHCEREELAESNPWRMVP